jgi:hypothetical protein
MHAFPSRGLWRFHRRGRISPAHQKHGIGPSQRARPFACRPGREQRPGAFVDQDDVENTFDGTMLEPVVENGDVASQLGQGGGSATT